MKKKLAVIIMAFIMMISGCSMALSQGEYYNRFSENYKAYNKNLLSLSAKLGEDRKSTRLNSSHIEESRMPSSA